MRPRRFSYLAALGWLNAHCPASPGAMREEVAARVAEHPWRVELGEATERAARAYIRHRLTDHDALYDIHALTQEEARAIAEDQVERIWREWRGFQP